MVQEMMSKSIKITYQMIGEVTQVQISKLILEDKMMMIQLGEQSETQLETLLETY